MTTTRHGLQIVGLLLSILLAGTLGYHLIEGWSFFDALYMSVITLATVGYGETHPLSVPGRVFTIFLILGGMGIILYGISEVTQFIVEGGIAGILRRRTMERAIKRMTNHYIICGAGSNGHYVLEELVRTKRKVVVVEKDAKKVQDLISREIPVIAGDASDDSVLQEAGIDRAAGLISSLPEDKDNLFVVITARGLNPNLRIIAKLDDVGVREKFLRSGADAAVSASYIGGLRMASELVRPETTTFLDTMLRDDAALRVDQARVGDSSACVGKKIAECEEISTAGVVLVSMKRGDESGQYLFNPPPDTVIGSGDVIIVIGSAERVTALRAKLAGA